MRHYLDHAATTPLLPESREAMLPWLGPEANASSLHSEGRAARAAVDSARQAIAECIGCLFGEIVFTSSGTEAANLALIGSALANSNPGRNRILVGATEHHCVLHCTPLLQRLGYLVDEVPADRESRIVPGALCKLLGDDVLLVSVMQANNETGAVNETRELAAMAASSGALFHSDAVQTFPQRFVFAGDLVSMSSHKTYGPAGVGALYIRAGTKISPVSLGGGQERDMRAGTENVAALVGFAHAANHFRNNDFGSEMRAARDALAAELLLHGFEATVRHGPILPGHFHCRCPGIDSERMLIRLDRAGVSASSGAACSSGSLEPSHVLLACGYTPKEAREGLRFSFGKDATVEAALDAARLVIDVAERIKRGRH